MQETLPAPQVRSKEIFRLFTQWKDRPFIFVDLPGNHGDYLIFAGAYKLAMLANLNYEKVSSRIFSDTPIASDHIVYINGGGACVSFWSEAPFRMLEYAVQNHSGPVILGPSCGYEKEFLRKKFSFLEQCKNPERITIFLRDAFSLDIFREVVPQGVNILLDHDTALNLAAEDFDIHPEFFPESPRYHFRGGYNYYAIRIDKEATSDVAKKDIFRFWEDPVAFAGPHFWKWFEVHRAARKIITNRLHSSILGSILGKPTYLAPNSWHKIRGVWEFSLKEKGVHWVDSLPEISLASRLITAFPWRDRIMNSWKVRHWRERFYGACDLQEQ